MTLSRMFRVAERDGRLLVHDPASGLTYAPAERLLEGRTVLPSSLLPTWPGVQRADRAGSAPVSLCWSPLVRCNLACPHCLDDKSVRELGPAHRARAAAAIGGSGVLGVDISGGEPLLLPNLTALADVLTSLGCVVSVTTNGWHLRRRAAELVGHLDAVRVSLDGPDAGTHNRWRGAGSFEKAIAGIQEAVRVGLPVQIQTVLMADNRHTAQALVGLAADHGAQGVTFLQMLPIGEGAELADEMLSDDDAQALVDRLEVPEDLSVRLRTRAAAGGFTVVRADGLIWRNDKEATSISARNRLDGPADLVLTRRDGSA